MIVLTMTETKEKHEQEIQCAVGNIRVDVNIVKHEIYCFPSFRPSVFIFFSNIIYATVAHIKLYL